MPERGQARKGIQRILWIQNQYMVPESGRNKVSRIEALKTESWYEKWMRSEGLETVSLDFGFWREGKRAVAVGGHREEAGLF